MNVSGGHVSYFTHCFCNMSTPVETLETHSVYFPESMEQFLRFDLIAFSQKGGEHVMCCTVSGHLGDRQLRQTRIIRESCGV